MWRRREAAWLCLAMMLLQLHVFASPFLARAKCRELRERVRHLRGAKEQQCGGVSPLSRDLEDSSED